MPEYFSGVRKIKYEGPDSKDPLSFKWYNPDRIVAGKKMSEHLKLSVCYWHTFRGTGADPFGGQTLFRPWGRETDPMAAAESTMCAAFEFFTKLGVSYWCFHDRDIAPEGTTIQETNKNLDQMVKKAAQFQKDTGVKLLWGTANCFSHPRYTHGAATNPDPRVFSYAASQIRRAIDATIALGGTGYVFWGGREGYSSILNTNLKQEREQLARMLQMSVTYGQQAGFKGMYFIEPKPQEPSKHQYDFDAATTLGFLREFGLFDNFQLNIEANHATLARHTFEHELMTAAISRKLGSIDINRGDLMLGWDTDQMPTDLTSATMALWIILEQGGLEYGGLNFDAKVRRGSFDTVDLFHAHIGAMDTLAKALLIADKIKRDGVFSKRLSDRYKGYQEGMGKKILDGKMTLAELEDWGMKLGEPALTSGREEELENILNSYFFSKID